ncbi:GyrI-like domain-containing protein [Facklamia sp. P13055]|uniref:GyrI-like domain-containing protein n=1 Tax=Facklamia sp. P13055 TaxID=3421952 RepID=UPI003D16580C
MDYQIEIKDIDPVRVAYMKYRGIVTDASKVFPKVFKSIHGKTSGSPFFNYITMNSETKVGDIELCVPTNEEPIGNGIEVKILPRIKAVCVTHIGTYETLYKAYEAIDRYSKENVLEISPPFRELFIKGPGMVFKGNPEKYITEIQFPIKGE